MSTPAEQMATAVPESNVRHQWTLATILQAERNELVEQVQNATSPSTLRQPGVCRHESDLLAQGTPYREVDFPPFHPSLPPPLPPPLPPLLPPFPSP